MTGMNNVETAIGKDDPLTLGAGIFDGNQQLIFRHHTPAQATFLMHRPT